MRYAPGRNQLIERLVWCLFSSAAILQFLPAAHASDWQLLQMCRDTGETVVSISNKGLKIETKQTHITIVCKAPDWNVYVFSTANKRMIKFDLAHYDGQFHMVFTAFGKPSFNMLPFRKFETGKLESIPIDKYKTSPEWAMQQINAYHTRAFSGIFPKYSDYWTAPSLCGSKEICTVISRNYGCPDYHAIPMQLTWLPVDGGDKEIQLRTVKVKPISLTDKDFEVPKGFTMVKEYQHLNSHTRADTNDTLLYDALKGFKDSYGGLK
jgi:hypothetical protein